MSTSTVTSTTTTSTQTKGLTSTKKDPSQGKNLASAQEAITFHGKNLLLSAKKGINSQGKKLLPGKTQTSGTEGLPFVQEAITQVVNVNFSLPQPEQQEYLQQVSQLSPPEPPLPKMALSREEFIQRFQLKEGAANPFTQQDIEYVNQMMRTYPLSDKVTLMSLFGMESIDLLKLLKDRKLLISSDFTNNMIGRWQGIYIKNSAVLQGLVGNTNLKRHRKENKFSKTDILTFDQWLKENLRQLQQNTSLSPEAQVLLKNFLKNWNKHQALFMKFISHDESSILLWETNLRALGANEVAQSLGQAVTGHMELLVKYATNNCESAHALVEGISPIVLAQFKELVRAFTDQTYLVGQTQQHMLPQYRMLTQQVAEKLEFFIALHNHEHSEREKARETKQAQCVSMQGPLLATCIIWIGDFYNTLQHSILPLLDSSHKMSRNYEERLYVSLTALAHPWKQLSEAPQPVTSLSGIRQEFIRQLSELQNEAKKIAERMDWYVQRGLVPFPFVSKQLKEFLKRLEPTTTTALQRLEALARAPSTLVNIHLLEETALIAQALLAVHDIKMLLTNSSGWPFDLPPKYLEFLALEKMTNPEGVLQIHLPQELLKGSSGIDPSVFTSETKKPPLLDEENSSLVHAFSVPKKELNPTNLASSTPKNDLPFEGTSRRQLLRALDRLGFYSVEGGAHTLVKNQSGQTITTVPRHNELNRNLVRLIGRQVLQSLE